MCPADGIPLGVFMFCPRLARCDFGVDAKRSGAGFPGRRERVRRVSRLFPFGRRQDFLCARGRRCRRTAGKRRKATAVACRFARRGFGVGGVRQSGVRERRLCSGGIRVCGCVVRASACVLQAARRGSRAVEGRAEDCAARSFAGRPHTNSSSVSSSCSLRPPPNMGEPKSARR